MLPHTTGTHRQGQWHPQTPQKECFEGLSFLVTRNVGNDVKGTEANGPLCDLVRKTKEATPLPPGVAGGPSQTPLSATHVLVASGLPGV